MGKIVELVQRCIAKRDVPRAFFYGILVIIPKDDQGGVRGIGLLEVIHKLISQIINLRMIRTINFCDEVHGFRRKRGTFTAIGETKIDMQVATCQSDTLYQVFVDLSKAYDSIDRERVLKLLKHYGMGPRLCACIEKVWDELVFVLRQSQFYSDKVSVDRGCTQGDVDSPPIFNIIIDAVLRIWLKQASEKKSKSRFYADDGLMQNTNPAELQNDLNFIISMFARIGLKANEKKTKFMIVRGAKAPQALSDIAYRNVNNGKKRRKVENTYQMRKKRDVECEICGKTMREVSLKRHMETQHEAKLAKHEERKPSVRGNFILENFTKGRFNPCPVPTCDGGGYDTFGVYRHFCNRHPEACIEIRGDKNVMQCNLCGMKCPDIIKHQKSDACRKNMQRRKNEKHQDHQAQADKVKFYVNGKEIKRVTKFLYLGRWFAEDDDDTLSITSNINSARSRWNNIVNILKREGANAICMGRFCLTVVQAVLLHGAESWTITSRNMAKLRSFHHRAVRYLTGDHIEKRDKTWCYPDHNKLLKKAKLLPIEKYIERRTL